MTKRKKYKNRVRERMSVTGHKFTKAKAEVDVKADSQQKPKAINRVENPTPEEVQEAQQGLKDAAFVAKAIRILPTTAPSIPEKLSPEELLMWKKKLQSVSSTVNPRILKILEEDLEKTGPELRNAKTNITLFGFTQKLPPARMKTVLDSSVKEEELDEFLYEEDSFFILLSADDIPSLSSLWKSAPDVSSYFSGR